MLTPESSPYMKSCPRCGAKIPTNIKGCWNCGEVLDPHIIELANSINFKKKAAEG